MTTNDNCLATLTATARAATRVVRQTCVDQRDADRYETAALAAVRALAEARTASELQEAANAAISSYCSGREALFALRDHAWGFAAQSGRYAPPCHYAGAVALAFSAGVRESGRTISWSIPSDPGNGGVWVDIS